MAQSIDVHVTIFGVTVGGKKDSAATFSSATRSGLYDHLVRVEHRGRDRVGQDLEVEAPHLAHLGGGDALRVRQELDRHALLLERLAPREVEHVVAALVLEVHPPLCAELGEHAPDGTAARVLAADPVRRGVLRVDNKRLVLRPQRQLHRREALHRAVRRLHIFIKEDRLVVVHADHELVATGGEALEENGVAAVKKVEASDREAAHALLLCRLLRRLPQDIGDAVSEIVRKLWA